MKLLTLTKRTQLDACQADWNRVATDRCFYSWDWNVNWFRAIADKSDQPWVIVGLDDQNNWVGIAPFFVSGRRLRMMGSGSACTDYAGLISSPQHQETFSNAVAEFLTAQVDSGGELENIDLIELEGGGQHDESLNHFCQQLETLGFSGHETETEGTWKLELPDSVDQLKTILSSLARRKVKKARKRLADESVSIEFADATTFDRHWTDFVDLHQKRREFLGQSGCFLDPKFENFLKEATYSLMQRQLADLFVIYRSGAPLGTQLLVHSESSCMMYQSGVAPEFFSEEPGYQAIVVALDHAIDRGAKYYDFLRGDENYKSRWGTTREAILHRRFVPKRFSARLKHQTWVIGRKIKHFVSAMV